MSSMSSQAPEWTVYHRLRRALPADVRVNVGNDFVRQCVEIEVTPEFGFGEPIRLRVPHWQIVGERAESRQSLGRLVTGVVIVVGAMRPPPRTAVVILHADTSGFANAMEQIARVERNIAEVGREASRASSVIARYGRSMSEVRSAAEESAENLRSLSVRAGDVGLGGAS